MRRRLDIEWRFAGPDDGAAYRTEIGRIWAVWLLALAVLVVGEGWLLTVAGIALIVVLLGLTRPLQQRATALARADTTEDSGTDDVDPALRDRILRELVFGEAPLVASGGGQGWVWTRRLIVGATAAAVAVVL